MRPDVANAQPANVTARPTRTDLPFHEALQMLLAARASLPTDVSGAGASMRSRRATLNALATRVGVGQSHLWRIVNKPDERRPSLALIKQVAEVLELPPDYFIETRAAVVSEYLSKHPKRLHRLYAEARRSR